MGRGVAGHLPLPQHPHPHPTPYLPGHQWLQQWFSPPSLTTTVYCLLLPQLGGSEIIPHVTSQSGDNPCPWLCGWMYTVVLEVLHLLWWAWMRYSRGCGSGDAAATQKVSVWCQWASFWGWIRCGLLLLTDPSEAWHSHSVKALGWPTLDCGFFDSSRHPGFLGGRNGVSPFPFPMNWKWCKTYVLQFRCSIKEMVRIRLSNIRGCGPTKFVVWTYMSEFECCWAIAMVPGSLCNIWWSYCTQSIHFVVTNLQIEFIWLRRVHKFLQNASVEETTQISTQHFRAGFYYFWKTNYIFFILFMFCMRHQCVMLTVVSLSLPWWVHRPQV